MGIVTWTFMAECPGISRPRQLPQCLTTLPGAGLGIHPNTEILQTERVLAYNLSPIHLFFMGTKNLWQGKLEMQYHQSLQKQSPVQ
jgi:hypothetical protein